MTNLRDPKQCPPFGKLYCRAIWRLSVYGVLMTHEQSLISEQYRNYNEYSPLI